MASRDRIQYALQSAQEGLQEQLQASPSLCSDAISTGIVHGLLSNLVGIWLSEEQQAQVQDILALHRQCLYGVPLESGISQDKGEPDAR